MSLQPCRLTWNLLPCGRLCGTWTVCSRYAPTPHAQIHWSFEGAPNRPSSCQSLCGCAWLGPVSMNIRTPREFFIFFMEHWAMGGHLNMALTSRTYPFHARFQFSLKLKFLFSWIPNSHRQQAWAKYRTKLGFILLLARFCHIQGEPWM